MISLRGSLRASPQANLAALYSLQLATASPAFARLATLACGLAERYRIYQAAH
jgi:hypothetical protein